MLPSLELREDACIEQTEQVPLGGGLGLEVPPEPALCSLLEDVELGVDVVACVGLVLLGPVVDPVDVGTRAVRGGVRVAAVGVALAVGSVVAGPDAVAVLGKSVSVFLFWWSWGGLGVLCGANARDVAPC